MTRVRAGLASVEMSKSPDVVRFADRVDDESEESESVCCGGPYGRLVFADPACEHDDVEAVEGGGHGRDLAAESVGVDGECETGAGVVSLDAGDDVAHVTGATGQSGESGVVFESVGDLAERQVAVLEEPQYEARVDGAGACGHDEAL